MEREKGYAYNDFGHKFQERMRLVPIIITMLYYGVFFLCFDFHVYIYIYLNMYTVHFYLF